MKLFDTQIVSYVIAGTRQTAVAAISSVTAQELLLMQGDSYRENRYYVPLLSNLRSQWGDSASYFRAMGDRSTVHRRRSMKRRTDKFVLDFGVDYPRIVEHSHLAAAEAINARRYDLLANCIQDLPRESRRAALRRLEFLAESDIRCFPLTVDAADLALELFGVFVEKYALKAKFRNSLNDILGVAVALHKNANLETEDRVLKEFIEGPAREIVQRWRMGSSVEESRGSSLPSRESKGYVNRGWRVTAMR